MANTIQIRRSAVQGAIPTTTQLQLGELALNTYDGKLYTKKNVSGTESIVDLTSAGTNAGFSYKFSTTTTAGDPGSGFFRFNSAVTTSITEMYISDLDTTATDRSGALIRLDDTPGTDRATIYLPGLSTGNNVSISVTGAITDNTTYLTIPVSYTSGGIPLDGQIRSVTGVRNGSDGATGSTATNLAGGSIGTLPYQSAANTTAMLAVGTAGQALVSAGAAAPAWTTLTMENLPDAAFKRSVRAATTANITLSGTQTLDGIAVVDGDRVLVKNQTTASANGIYVVAVGAWSRATDADTASEIAGGTVNIDNGTQGGQIWRTTFKATDTLGTTSMTWASVLDTTFGNSTAGTIATNGTQSAGTSNLYARADHVHPTDTSRAPLASPGLTGTPTAPTATVNTNTTQIATTAFVLAQASSTAPADVGTTAATGTSTTFARADHVHDLNSASLTGNLTLAAGTASLSPLTMTSGTLLTTPAAGVNEYDGRVYYKTPAASGGRALSPSAYLYRLNTAVAGANVTTTQSIFGVGLTVNAATAYVFEATLLFSKTVGALAHNFNILFGGTATLTNIMYEATAIQLTSALGNGQRLEGTFALSTAANTVCAMTATATQNAFVQLKGSFAVNAAGTFIPQYSLSAAPGGAYSTSIGSFISIYPIGTNAANASIGAWA